MVFSSANASRTSGSGGWWGFDALAGNGNVYCPAILGRNNIFSGFRGERGGIVGTAAVCPIGATSRRVARDTARLRARFAAKLGEIPSRSGRGLVRIAAIFTQKTRFLVGHAKKNGSGTSVAFQWVQHRLSIDNATEFPSPTAHAGACMETYAPNALSGLRLKQQAVAEVIAGRMSLQDAADRFRVATAARPELDGDTMCRSVIGWVHLALSDQPERAERIAGRLEIELGNAGPRSERLSAAV